jgi:hypothetical protein
MRPVKQIKSARVLSNAITGRSSGIGLYYQITWDGVPGGPL